ncbi:MAG: hypothetical protein NT164_04750 [Verrucomicrobiae bacterium]|nr:hypothetical protein [Verrucomicrobiae bacterium]
MPIFGTQILGTSTDVTSVEQLQKLDPKTRLSVQQRDRKNVLVATKGTLSNGLYSLWAYFRPESAHQARLDTLNTLKQVISEEFHIVAASIGLISKNDEQTSTQNFQGTCLTVSNFQGPNLKNYFNFTEIKRLKPSLTETATNDPSANFSPLERILYRACPNELQSSA